MDFLLFLIGLVDAVVVDPDSGRGLRVVRLAIASDELRKMVGSDRAIRRVYHSGSVARPKALVCLRSWPGVADRYEWLPSVLDQFVCRVAWPQCKYTEWLIV